VVEEVVYEEPPARVVRPVARPVEEVVYEEPPARVVRPVARPVEEVEAVVDDPAPRARPRRVEY
jgi:hypothetical protein